jgi:hypothetical protein
MSTFVLPNTKVIVTLSPDITQEQLLGFPAFKNWISSLGHSISLQDSDKHHAFSASPYKLQRINVQAVDWFGGKKLGFVKLTADIVNDNGDTLPGSVFLRGGSVAMMVRGY